MSLEDKYFRKEENLSLIIPIKFDAREELDAALRSLEYGIIQPINSQFIRRPEFEAKLAKEQRDGTLAQINSAQQRYLARLESARKAGVINNEDYLKALLDAQSPLGHFDAMKRKAQEDYRKTVKWDF